MQLKSYKKCTLLELSLWQHIRLFAIFYMLFWHKTYFYRYMEQKLPYFKYTKPRKESIMRTHDDFINPKSLIEQINLSNTVNGGVSATYMHISHNGEQAFIKMRMPGVSQDAYRLSVVLDQLQIHTVLSTDDDKSLGEQPTITRNLPLPAIVDVEGIEARFEGDMLLVTLPFKSPDDRLPREIQIGF